MLPTDTRQRVEEAGAFTENIKRDSLKAELENIGYTESNVSTTTVRSLDLIDCSKSDLLGKIISQMNDFFPNCKLRQIFYVIDGSAPTAANQKFHFDTIPSIKFIFNISGSGKGGTEFAVGSHKGWRQKVNKLVVKRGFYGHHKYGFQNVNVDKYSKIDTKNSNIAIFDTDIVHRALVDPSVTIESPRKTLIAAWTKPI